MNIDLGKPLSRGHWFPKSSDTGFMPIEEVNKIVWDYLWASLIHFAGHLGSNLNVYISSK